jgi:hypothetical protein
MVTEFCGFLFIKWTGLKEKILMASLIRDMGKAIENKKTDALSIERKNSAWERITTQYNSQPESTTVRTAQQLKKLGANIQYTKYVVDIYLELFLLLLRQQSHKKFPSCDR